MESKKKKLNWFKVIMISLFVCYISLYMLNVTGYYDGNIRKKVEFTEAQIEQFEADVKNGEKVDVKDYLVEQNKDYSNGASKLGYTLSSNVDKFLNKGIKGFLKVIIRMLS